MSLRDPLVCAMRRDWRIGVACATAAAGGAGLLVGVLTPRGPGTTDQALAAIALGLGIGVVAGLAMSSRWAMLVTPTVFVAAFELARLGEAGPTVDAIHLGTPYGIIAFATGRLLHWVLTLVPMLLGAALGAGFARHRIAPAPAASTPHRGQRWLYVRRSVVGLTGVGLVALVVQLARPARTASIHGANGAIIPGSVAELTTVPIRGRHQALMIRGRSIRAPVLLFLAGGPGGSEIGSMRNLGQGLEQDFVVVTWDQPGAGKSANALEPTLTMQQVVSDGIAVTNYLRHRFHQQKIYLVGNSWGTLIGVRAVQQHPELFHAFVGAGQMVCPTATDRMFYEDTFAWARRTGNVALADALRRNGPPPYGNVSRYEPVLSHEHDWNPYPHADARFSAKGEMPGNLFVREFSLMEQLRAMGNFLDTFAVLYPQLKDVDFRRDATTLAVPVYLIQGRYEARGRALPANEWFASLSAPSKRRIEFDRSGHKPLFEEPDRFRTVMSEIMHATLPP